MDIKIPPLGEGASSGTVINILSKKATRSKKIKQLLN
jgi:hypothetical protein